MSGELNLSAELTLIVRGGLLLFCYEGNISVWQGAH